MQNLQKIKNKNLHRETFVFNGVKVKIRPIRINREDAAITAEWRSKFFKSFFTWIKPSQNDMLGWLKKYYKGNSGDIIFIIEICGAGPLGQMALYNIDFHKKQAEFGRLIKGDKKRGPKDIMTFAIKRLLRWAFDCLKLKNIFLEVFADNRHAVALYKALGFRIRGSLKFQKVLLRNGVIQWVRATRNTMSPLDSQPKHKKVYQMVITNKLYNLKNLL